jgi:hypothetical protein
MTVTVPNDDMTSLLPTATAQDGEKAEYSGGRRDLSLNTPTYGYFNVADTQTGYEVAKTLNSLYHSFGGRVRKLITDKKQHKYEFFYPTLIGKRTFLARIEAKQGDAVVKKLKNVEFIYGEPDQATLELLKKRKSGPFHPGEIQLQGSVWFDTGFTESSIDETEITAETVTTP